MVQISELSKIGYGSYRITNKRDEHVKALTTAINFGCNLIDTAPNYTNGGSEQLIGEVISKLGRQKVFIITKAGYIQGDDLQQIKKLNFSNVRRIKDTFWYSLGNDFLDFQLKNSLKRLGTNYVDSFLLHNPEHYLVPKNDTSIDKDSVYLFIKEAFAYLEDKVREGIIRYYGISSNTLPFSDRNDDTLSLSKVLSLASEVSTVHHFRFVQFPFNIFENQASIAYNNDESLIDHCKRVGLITLGNRPLNAQENNKFVRLATYEDVVEGIDEESTNKAFEVFFDLILKKLKELNMSDQWHEFPILIHLKNNWKNFGNDEAIEAVVKGHLFPFLHSLFEGSIPSLVIESIGPLVNAMTTFTKKGMNEKALMIENNLVEKGIITKNDRPFSYRLCNHYLEKGVDHVLVGMRKEKYVLDLRDGFQKH